MAYFAARDEPPAAYCRRRVADSDVYVGLIGFRYGSPAREEPDYSYTELEFDAATAAGLPRLLFLLQEDAPVPAAVFRDVTHADRQLRFRHRLMDGPRIVGMFASPDQLETLVFQALIEQTMSAVRHRIKADVAPSPPFLVPAVDGVLVERPQLAGQLVDLLCTGSPAQVGLTTALEGAGGFGKTTLAAAVCRLPEVRNRFPDGILWVTVGQQTTDADLAVKVNELAAQIAGSRPTFTDVEQAGHHLGQLLDHGVRLLVIDDVWHADQLSPFLSGGQSCVRLITTRLRDVLPAGARQLLVDAMEPAEACAMLAAGLPSTPRNITVLRRQAGNWPVLLTLINGALRDYTERGMGVDEAAERIADGLAAAGPTALDVTSSTARQRAVSATINASLELLAAHQPAWLDRFLELAVFPEDTAIPESTLRTYWAATGGLQTIETDRLCIRLAHLHLVQSYRLDPPRLQLHDVIRDYLRQQVGPRLPELHAALVDAHQPALLTGSSWWSLPSDEPYLWQHLTTHLAAAGRAEELTRLVADLRWIVEKTRLFGPSAVDADLALVDDPLAERLRRAFGQAAHLLGPLQPDHALGATLLTRLYGSAGLETVSRPYTDSFPATRLSPVWPLPDWPHPALHRALAGHRASVTSLALNHAAGWAASGGADATIRIWDTTTYQQTRILRAPGPVRALAAAPDGSWLASAGDDHTITLWDGEQKQAVLAGHTATVRSLTTHGVDDHLVSGSDDGTIRIWDTGTAATLNVLTRGHGPVLALASHPDGALIAAGSQDGAVLLWQPNPVSSPIVMPGHVGAVRAVAFSPDGRYLASGGDDRTIRIVTVSHGQLVRTLHGYLGPIWALAYSPDGQWIAAGGGTDRSVRIWSSHDGHMTATISGHAGWIDALAYTADGAWLLSSGGDGTIRIWNATDIHLATVSRRPHAVWADTVTVHPHTRWIATITSEDTVQRWDPDTAQPLGEPLPHPGWPSALAASHDGTQLATGCVDGNVRVWNPDVSKLIATLTGHTSTIRALAFDPRWLASADNDGWLHLWNTTDFALTHRIDTQTGRINALAATPDGHYILHAGDDGTIYQRETQTGKLVNVLPTGPHRIRFLTVSSDGTYLAAGGNDHAVRLWNLPTRQLLTTLAAHTEPVRGAAFTSDTTHLATVGQDRTAHIWTIPSLNHLTAIRLDGILWGCAWLPHTTRLTLAASSGLYLFTLTGPHETVTSPAATQPQMAAPDDAL